MWSVHVSRVVTSVDTCAPGVPRAAMIAVCGTDPVVKCGDDGWALAQHARALLESAARMQRRFEASLSAGPDVAGVLVATAAKRVRAHHAVVAERVKALTALLDAWKVSAEQLSALAVTLEADAATGDVLRVTADSVTAPRRVVLALCDRFEIPMPLFSHLPVHRDDETALSPCYRVRAGVSADHCVASGPGLRGSVCGEGEAATAHNVVAVSVVGECGENIQCEEGDVDVTCTPGSAAVVAVGVDGRVRVGYSVPLGTVSDVVLAVHVFGSQVAGSPWRIRVRLRS